MNPVSFVTLGPNGTCHDEATREYAKHHNLDQPVLRYITDFKKAAEMLKDGEVDFAVQGCAHPQVSEMIEIHFKEVFMIDTFMYPTKDLAILTRRGIDIPSSIGYMPVTRNYYDLSQWSDHIHETSNVAVLNGLIEGKYDSAITFSSVMQDHGDRFKIKHHIGRVNMAWLVYGREAMDDGKIVGTLKAFPRQSMCQGAK